jgi:hypothetical protein
MYFFYFKHYQVLAIRDMTSMVLDLRLLRINIIVIVPAILSFRISDFIHTIH